MISFFLCEFTKMNIKIPLFDVSLFGDLNGVASHQYTFDVGQTQLLN